MNAPKAPNPKRLIAQYLQATADINDGYKAPEIRQAAADYLTWLEDVIIRGLAAAGPESSGQDTPE